MMKRKKRFFAMSLAVCMLLSLLTACGGGTKGTQDGSASTSTVAASDVSKENDKPVKIVALMAPPTNYKPTDPNVLKQITDKILKDINVEFEFIVGPLDVSEYQTKLNLMLAGNEQLDIAETFWEPLHSKNMIAELTDSVKSDGQDLVSLVTDANLASGKDSDGKLWAIPRMPYACVSYPVMVRSDWLTKVGLSAPTTIDELEKVAIAFRDQDPAGGGKTIPLLTTMAHARFALAGAFIENGWSQYKGEDGRIYPPYMNEGYRDFVSKLADWYQNGLIAKEAFVYKTADIADAVKANRIGSTALWYSRITLNEGALQKSVPDAHYEICQIQGPKGIAETANYVKKLPEAGSGSGSGTNSFVVFKNSKDVNAAVRLLNWGYQDNNYLISKYGMEGEGFEMISDTPEMKEYKVLIDQTGDEVRALYNGFLEYYYMPSGSEIQRHLEYLCKPPKEMLNLERAKKPFDGDVKYDSLAMNDAVPTYPDIQRIIDESFVEFVTGGKPLSEFDKFYSELKSAGVESLIDEITRQYNEATK